MQNSSKMPTWKVNIEYGPTAHDVHKITVEAETQEEAREKAEQWAIDNRVRAPMISNPVMEDDFTDYLEWTEEEEEAFLHIVEKDSNGGI